MNGGDASSAATWDARHASRLEIVARQMATGMGPYALEGHVGDCCDDEEVTPAQVSDSCHDKTI